MGTLKITGTIDINQFWNKGNSDGDTIKVKVNKQSFQYTGGNTFKTTQVFFNNKVSSQHGLLAIVNSKNETDVRLEGIDTPELHYKIYGAPPRGNLTDAGYDKLKEANKKEYSQYYARTAAMELAKKLSLLAKGAGNVTCEVVSTGVDKPGDVCDSNGRFVAMVWVNGINLNYWLAEQGWALPGFYTSTQPNDVKAITAGAKAARGKAKGLWKHYSELLQPVNFAQLLPYAKANKTYNAKADKGTVLFPKLFRRLVTYKIYTDAGIDKGTFTDYIAKGADRIIRNGKSEKFSLVVKTGKLTLAPEQLVFKEEAATLKDSEGNKVTAWFS